MYLLHKHCVDIVKACSAHEHLTFCNILIASKKKVIHIYPYDGKNSNCSSR